jgi:hypothetical protein
MDSTRDTPRHIDGTNIRDRPLSCANPRRNKRMTRYLLAGALVAAGFGFLTPSFVAPATAQGVSVDVPGVRVGVGERRHRSHEERRVYMRDDSRRGCRTVTIERDDGSVKRIRKCD